MSERALYGYRGRIAMILTDDCFCEMEHGFGMRYVQAEPNLNATVTLHPPHATAKNSCVTELAFIRFIRCARHYHPMPSGIFLLVDQR